MTLDEIDTLSDLKLWLGENMPGADVYEDMHGTLVIRTGLTSTMGGYLHPIERERVMDTTKLLSNSAYQDALYGWEPVSENIRLGQKIRITFDGLKPKTGYAYKEDGAWLGIRYTWKSYRWWSLLNYNNPLTKLEVEEDGNYTTLWERE